MLDINNAPVSSRIMISTLPATALVFATAIPAQNPLVL
jgi:hypothetical protein